MIKIRYADLPGGLHVRVVESGKDPIIYLLPGLTAAQRRAALRRARSSARLGHGPRLPAVGVASAVTADRIWTTVRNAAAAIRRHPTAFAPPIAIIVSAAAAYVLLVSVSARVHLPQAGGPGNRFGAPIVPAAGAPRSSRPPREGHQLARISLLGPSAGRLRMPAPRRSGAESHGAGTAPTPGQDPVGGATPGAAPSPTPTPPQPTPSPVPSPSPRGPGSGSPGSDSSGGSGLCLDVGPLGVCLSV